MALRQILTLGNSSQIWPLSFSAHSDELPGLVVSTLAFLALIFLDRLLRERIDYSNRLESTNQHLEKEIAERKQTENALNETTSLFKITIDQMPAAVSLKDPEGRYIVVNQTFHDWFNPDKLDLSINTVRDLVNADHTEEIVAMEQEVRDAQAPLTREMEVPVAGHGWRNAFIHKFPIFDATGSLSAIGTIETDNTDLREAEKHLQRAQKMEAIGQLTGGIAHDFNNLLAIIQGNAELLSAEGGTIDPKLRAILRSSKRGAELTQRLLSFSRQQPLRAQPTDLTELTAGMTTLLKPAVGETIEIASGGSSDLWPVLVDPGQLENALLNLAINARGAMPEGGKLTIECTNATLGESYVAQNPETEAGDYVLMAVGDTGMGMSDEVREHAFEPFFTTKEVGKGSGLGLSMVYGFAKQSGGHVTIDSEPGQGTTVRLYLPRAPQ